MTHRPARSYPDPELTSNTGRRHLNAIGQFPKAAGAATPLADPAIATHLPTRVLGEPEIYAYGNADETYDGPCRFWIEIRKGETTSQAAFARALGIVNQYFLLSNSSEVNRILMEAE